MAKSIRAASCRGEPDLEKKKPKAFVRRAGERGHADHGWLNSYHTFSFADYHDPDFMGFRALRVINEDRVQGGQGFPTHGHRDMEIISYIIDGELEHKDSMGTGSVIRPGDFQKMSAGTGVRHSEFNHSKTNQVHFLQIWIIPEKNGIPPNYGQKHFPEAERTGQLRLVGSRDGHADTIQIQQDVNLYSAILKPGQTIADRVKDGRYAWVQVVRGALQINGELLSAGDGIAFLEGGPIEMDAPIDGENAEVLLFDLA
jgi:redox-sensitive bicupin YhaK (pirin superfamily)